MFLGNIFHGFRDCGPKSGQLPRLIKNQFFWVCGFLLFESSAMRRSKLSKTAFEKLTDLERGLEILLA